MAKALAAALEAKPPLFDRSEVRQLVEHPASLNHFELGGYVLKSLYSNPDNFAEIDPSLLGRLAAHRCYPGRSILGDLLLNLVYQKRDVQRLLPPHDGANGAFGNSIWDFVA